MHIILDGKYRIENWFDWSGYIWENFAAGDMVFQESEGRHDSFVFTSVDFDAMVVQLRSAGGI